MEIALNKVIEKQGIYFIFKLDKIQCCFHRFFHLWNIDFTLRPIACFCESYLRIN